FLHILDPPCSPLFPYTTLFRSERRRAVQRQLGEVLLDHQTTYARRVEVAARAAGALGHPSYRALVEATSGPLQPLLDSCAARRRSEEHTSELQSRGHLVCRLLL